MPMSEADAPRVNITYFKPDETKDGGEYVTVEGQVKKVDLYQKIIVWGDGSVIPTNDIAKIDGDSLNVDF